MRKFRIFGTLAAAALLASCSSEDVVGTGNSAALKGDGYVSFAINLPTTRATRAANDKFDDGTYQEYSVKDAILVLFQGTSENDATVTTAYNLNLNMNLDGTTTDQITSTTKVVQKINDAQKAGTTKYYALVVLNNNNILSVSDADNTLKIGTVDCTGKKLTDFMSQVVDLSTSTLYSSSSNDNFLMCNAPLSTVQGGTTPTTAPASKLQTLAEIDPTMIKETEAEAAKNPAAEINVERAAVKVTLTAKDGKVTDMDKTATTPSNSYSIVGWNLNNTNKSTYLVRNVNSFGEWAGLKSNSTVSTAADYRFIGGNALTNTITKASLYRTYWGTDPNYTPTNDGEGIKYWDETSSYVNDSWWLSSGSVAYCAENTFDVANQKDANSTSAILKVKFNNGTTFYTVNSDESTIYSETDIVKYIKNQFLTNTSIAHELKKYVADGKEIGESDIEVTLGGKTTDATTSSEVEYAGLIGVKKITLKATPNTKLTADLDAEEIYVDGASQAGDASCNTAIYKLNKSITLRRYLNGMAYYAVIIKHFGDDLTPWRNGETDQPSAGTIYPSNSSANYLGRYGVLRNNWYDIEVTAIKNLGAATVPTLGTTGTPDQGTTPPGTPDGPGGPTGPDEPDGPNNGGFDDDLDQYLSVKINVLSWAKRTQSVEL